MQGGNDRRDLSAPESYILLHGPKGGLEPEGEAFRLALVELAVRGWISREDLGQESQDLSGDALLVRGNTDFAPRDRPLLAALSVFEGALSEAGDPDKGIPAEGVFSAARERYGELSAYVEEDVLPSLETRGYYEYADDRLLGIIPRKRWRETEAGKRTREDLERTTQEARELPELVRRDPERARSFVDGAGPALLLMPFLYPDVAGLSGALVGGQEGELDPSAFEGLSGISESLDSAIPESAGDWIGAPGDAGEGGGLFGGDGGGGFGGDGGGGI